MTDLPSLDELAERAQRILDGYGVVRFRNVAEHVAARPEEAHLPIGPVELVEVDVVGLQALQRLVDRVVDIGLVEACAPAVGPEPG